MTARQRPPRGGGGGGGWGSSNKQVGLNWVGWKAWIALNHFDQFHLDSIVDLVPKDGQGCHRDSMVGSLIQAVGATMHDESPDAGVCKDIILGSPLGGPHPIWQVKRLQRQVAWHQQLVMLRHVANVSASALRQMLSSGSMSRPPD